MIMRIISVCLLSIAFCHPVAGQSPTLSADAAQPVYPGTSVSPLAITAGSGKTSYLSAVQNDPTDPASGNGIIFTVTGNNPVVTATSNNSSVANNTNISVTNENGKYVVRVNPAGTGYATITVRASNSSGNSSAYSLRYASSAGAANPGGTVFHSFSSDASGAAILDSQYYFIADDESNVLRLYHRRQSGRPVYSTDIESAVGASSECDLEGASLSVKFQPGRRIYWLGSLGNNKSGNLRPDRNRAIATDISGFSSSATLSVRSYSTQFRNALISWGNAAGWNFTASAASGMIPKRVDGFNAEGLTVTHGGDTAYIGLRAPLVPLQGETPTTQNRRYAVLAPVHNFETILNGSGNVSTSPVMGSPLLFDLEGLGFRSIERTAGGYLIVAGLFTGGGMPAVYFWDGRIPPNPGKNPVRQHSPVSTLIKLPLSGLDQLVQVSPDGEPEGHPEALVCDTAGNEFRITLISDNGTLDYYNDGTEAKDLSQDAYKKFRSDRFRISADTLYGTEYYLCPGISEIWLTGNLSANQYQWQRDTCGNGCYADLAEGAGLTGTQTRTLHLSGITSVWNGYRFRCVTDMGNSKEYTLRHTLTWTGAINNQWEIAGNWDCNAVPDAGTDVYINSGTPVINSAVEIRTLTLNKSSQLSINSGKSLTILE